MLAGSSEIAIEPTVVAQQRLRLDSIELVVIGRDRRRAAVDDLDRQAARRRETPLERLLEFARLKLLLDECVEVVPGERHQGRARVVPGANRDLPQIDSV